MTNDEARDLLQAELSKHLDPDDRVRVSVQAFRDYIPIDLDEEFMSDPATLTYMLIARFSRHIVGQQFAARLEVDPIVPSDTLALAGIAEQQVRTWERLRDAAIRTGPPPVIA